MDEAGQFLSLLHAVLCLVSQGRFDDLAHRVAWHLLYERNVPRHLVVCEVFLAAGDQIHPKHVASVNEAFLPSRAELAWAQKVLNAFATEPSAGVVRIDGKMIDKPHARAARAILAAARPRN